MHFGRPIRCKLALERMRKPGTTQRRQQLENEQRHDMRDAATRDCAADDDELAQGRPTLRETLKMRSTIALLMPARSLDDKTRSERQKPRITAQKPEIYSRPN